MPKVVFTPNLHRFFNCAETTAGGNTVREVLDGVFQEHPEARGYVLDDQAALRRHMTIFVDGEMIRDRIRLSDPVRERSTVYVFQALSGG
jgi:hypothetical protein